MKLGFIGVGKMGSALVGGILRAKLCQPADVIVHDAYGAAVEACVKEHGVTVVATNREVFEQSKATLLCVKPQDVPATLKEMHGVKSARVLISIAAGISIANLEKLLGKPHRVVRVMPNTPALIGQGASGFALGATATEADAKLVNSILESVGVAVQVKEAQLDAVTGLSGSGPAYVFTIIEALADGGVLEGLPKPIALKLAAQTVLGAAGLVQQTGEHPAVLRDNVTSPGGTTIAGLAQLEANGLRSALIEAVRAAARRSRELGES